MYYKLYPWQPCIEQWNVNHKTCPVCRETLASTEDGWVIRSVIGGAAVVFSSIVPNVAVTGRTVLTSRRRSRNL